MIKNRGGPAFPTICHAEGVYEEGMTLRDYFAAKAMQAVLTGLVTTSERPVSTELANLSYKIADAMIAESKK